MSRSGSGKMLTFSEICIFRSLLEAYEEVELKIHLGLSGFRLFYYDDCRAIDFLVHVDDVAVYVKRICLNCRRAGLWSRIFNLLCSVALSNNIRYIVIDYAYTYEMVKWCNKYSLVPDIDYSWVINNVVYGRYTYRLPGD